MTEQQRLELKAAKFADAVEAVAVAVVKRERAGLDFMKKAAQLDVNVKKQKLVDVLKSDL